MTTIGRAAPLLLALLVTLCTGRAQAGCPDGDLTGDCTVDAADLRLFAELWLITTSETVADMNRDAHVDGEDLALLADDWGHRGCPIVINEVLAHSHADAPDWIELHNISSVPVDIGGWSLSDSAGNRDKFVIDPGTVIDPFGYIVFYENTHFGNWLYPGTRTPFALSENGETLYLSSSPNNAFGECVLAEAFGASETDHSFGRYRKSTDTVNFVTMNVPTPGEGNAYPLVGPVVINEVMYHPAGDGDAEYVELLNVSGIAITLFDFMAMEPWRFVDESGIDFWFPADPPVTLRADEHLLLVKDASEVGIYGVSPAAQVFEWGAGKLANEGEKLQLLKPGDVDEVGTRYWIEVDRLSYSDGSRGDGVDPWPIEADGLGRSLNRLFPSRYGNDPNNWHATIPTPGATND